MGTIRISRDGEIDAAAERVYSILADYRVGHPSILPKSYFGPLTVEEGGVGAGTRIRFELTTPGATREVRALITEPQPGRVLVETDERTGARTTFEVVPLDERRSSVTITTEWETRGVAGLIERLLAPGLLRKIYAEELANLNRVAAGAP